jgi:hypothetical protein
MQLIVMIIFIIFGQQIEFYPSVRRVYDDGAGGTSAGFAHKSTTVLQEIAGDFSLRNHGS